MKIWPMVQNNRWSNVLVKLPNIHKDRSIAYEKIRIINLSPMVDYITSVFIPRNSLNQLHFVSFFPVPVPL